MITLFASGVLQIHIRFFKLTEIFILIFQLLLHDLIFLLKLIQNILEISLNGIFLFFEDIISFFMIVGHLIYFVFVIFNSSIEFLFISWFFILDTFFEPFFFFIIESFYFIKFLFGSKIVFSNKIFDFIVFFLNLLLKFLFSLLISFFTKL